MATESKIVNTLDEVRELLAEQIVESAPVNGDFLAGRTVEEAVAESFNFPGAIRDEEQIRKYVERSIEDWRQHKGERMLFVAEQTTIGDAPPPTNIRVTITKIWESEMENYVGRTFIRHLAGSTVIPLFDGDTV